METDGGGEEGEFFLEASWLARICSWDSQQFILRRFTSKKVVFKFISPMTLWCMVAKR